jgi:hypothetical protein
MQSQEETIRQLLSEALDVIERYDAAQTELVKTLQEFLRVMEDSRTTAAMPATVKRAKAAVSKAKEVKLSAEWLQRAKEAANS